MLHQVGRFEEASDAYEKALGAKRESLGPDHFSVGNTLYNLAFLAMDRQRPKEAMVFMRETLDIYTVGRCWTD